jgi:hypothetical protein
MTILGIAKRLRLKARYPDGSATYDMTSADGSSGLLMIGPDGTRLEHVIEGVDMARAMGLTGPALSPVIAPSEVTPPQPIQALVQDTPAPVVEPEPVPEPAPGPPNEKLDRDAQMVARSVWFHGGQHRNQLFQSRSRMAADELLAYAVERQWLSVREDMVVPGTVTPVPRMPVVERSRSERVLSWGPGPGARW